MSQFPYQSPYTPPTAPAYGYYGSYADPLTIPKRAGLLMLVLGALGLMLGGCIAGMTQLPVEFIEQIKARQPNAVFPTHAELFIGGASFFVPGLLLIIFGFLTRSGKGWAIVTSIVLTSLVIALLSLNALSLIISASSQPPESLLFGGCLIVVAMALFVLLLVTLIKARGAAKQAEVMQQQYAAWYAYEQQRLAEGGSEYPVATPPPPPPQV